MTTRLKYVDIASGIMIIWLLLFHALYPMIGSNITGKIPYLYFFMPWFFYKSGMMFKVKPGRECLKKDFKKLIRIYIKWSLIGYFIHVLWHYYYYDDLSLRVALYVPVRSFLLSASIPLNGALWFIPILFCVRQLSNYFLKFLHPLVLALCSLAIYNFILDIDWCYMPKWIDGTLWGLYCFVMGYYLIQYEYTPLLAILSTAVFILSLFTVLPSGYCVELSQPLKIVWLIACVCSCVFFNNLCKLFVVIADNLCKCTRTFPFIQYVGRHSMTYYVGHYVIFRLTFDSIARLNLDWYNNWQGLAITFVMYCVILTTICIVNDKVSQRKKLV